LKWNEGQAHWISRVVLYEVGHRAFHRRGKAHGLPFFSRIEAIRRIAGRNPMSSMRSASSSTNIAAREMNQPAVEKIFQASGSRYDQAGAFADRV